MKFILADVNGSAGFVTKDTVMGGFGSRLVPFSFTTRMICRVKRRFHNVPSVQMAYAAAILAEKGHEVVHARHGMPEGDVALVLSSMVDHRNETRWAAEARRRGIRVGFLGIATMFLPELFEDHADFLIQGEPEEAVRRLANGEKIEGRCHSEAVQNLDSLPFPRWDLVVNGNRPRVRLPINSRPFGGGFPLLASRGCPEHCTYCPHRILAADRRRSPGNIADEIQQLAERYPRPYVIFRDPIFTQDRERCVALCDEILARGIKVRFECETRLDRLDETLVRLLYRAGLRLISFGVESVDPNVLKKVGRRTPSQEHQRMIVGLCDEVGIVTSGYFVLGFPEDDWDSITATIRYSVELSPTFAQFKVLTPYPGTPLWKKMEPLIQERDWERFDGYNVTFAHPKLKTEELRFLLGAAYSRFYLRPSYLANYLRIRNGTVRKLFQRWDRRVTDRHRDEEQRAHARIVY